MKTIFSIIPYLYTEKDMYELRERFKEYPNRHFFNHLPEWCMREDNGLMDYTENYHQFTGQILTDPTRGYNLFDINPVDEILKEEISNVGVEEIFSGFDWRPIFSLIIPNDPYHKSSGIPSNVHVVVDIIYERSGDDFDMFIQVLGILDGTMNLLRI